MSGVIIPGVLFGVLIFGVFSGVQWASLFPASFSRRLHFPASFFRIWESSGVWRPTGCRPASRPVFPSFRFSIPDVFCRRHSFSASFPRHLYFASSFSASLFPASFITNVAYLARHETGGRPVGSPLMHSPIGIALRSGTEGDTSPRSAPHRRAPAPSLAPVATAAASYSYAVYTIPRMLESLQYGIGEGNLHLL